MSEELLADKGENLKMQTEMFFKRKFESIKMAASHIMTLRYPQKETIDKLAVYLKIDVMANLKKYAPYMRKRDVDSLIADGHTVGAHSQDHPEFYLLSEDEQVEQVSNSLREVEEVFNPNYKVFAFPFTDVGVNTSFFRKIEDQCKPDLTFASSGIKKDKEKCNIHRISMDDRGLNAERRLKSEFLYYGLKLLLGKNTYKRK
jgi:peptidoglycan/xylan/chitin deacetylase (PgdA/CDA1 family)